MKRLVKIIILVTLTALLSCKKGKSDISGTYQLIENTSVNFSQGNQNFTITASNLKDSRCPKDVNCVWEGYATTDLTIKSNVETDKTFKLCTGGCNLVKLAKEETITINGIAYLMQLKDITISSSNQKTAIITLTKN